MRHIKNFFHNINDVVLAIIIVALAAGIIFWRMQVILDYPKKLVESQTVSEETTEETAPAEETAPSDSYSEAIAALAAEVKKLKEGIQLENINKVEMDHPAHTTDDALDILAGLINPDAIKKKEE